MVRAEYAIAVDESAIKFMANLEKKIRRQIGSRIDALAQNPRPRGVKPLEGEEGIYRIRSGDYRIVYQVNDGAKSVYVLRIAHHRDVYRNIRVRISSKQRRPS